MTFGYQVLVFRKPEPTGYNTGKLRSAWKDPSSTPMKILIKFVAFWWFADKCRLDNENPLNAVDWLTVEGKEGGRRRRNSFPPSFEGVQFWVSYVLTCRWFCCPFFVWSFRFTGFIYGVYFECTSIIRIVVVVVVWLVTSVGSVRRQGLKSRGLKTWSLA